MPSKNREIKNILLVGLSLIILACTKPKEEFHELVLQADTDIKSVGEIVLGDSTYPISFITSVSKIESPYRNGLDDYLLVVHDHNYENNRYIALTFNVFKSTHQTSFNGTYAYSNEVKENSIGFGYVYTDSYDSIANDSRSDYEVLNGVFKIDTTSARYLEWPNKEKEFWGHDYYQEVEITFSGLLVESERTLQFGNEKIDTLIYSGFYRGLVTFEDDTN